LLKTAAAVDSLYTLVSLIELQQVEMALDYDQGFKRFVLENLEDSNLPHLEDNQAPFAPEAYQSYALSMLKYDQKLLASIQAQPLEVQSLHYGSPAVEDLLGLGKALEMLVEIVKLVLWKGKHEREMAASEHRRSQLEAQILQEKLTQEQFETSKKEMELADRRIKAILKLKDRKLSSRQEQQLLEMVYTSAERIADESRLDVRLMAHTSSRVDHG
jgi:hypothetical protein